MSPVYSNAFLLIGTIIGAGIFSLPIALNQVGSLIFIIMIIGLSILLGFVSLLYREIIDDVKGHHQLPGYARLILGKRVGRFATITLFLSTAGALLAYLIIGGQFVANIFQITPNLGSLIFYLGVIITLLVAGEHMKIFDIAFSVIKLALIAVIILLAFFSPSFIMKETIPVIGSSPLAAYGSILFALTGVSIMPELKKNKKINLSVLLSSVAVIAAYILFAFGYYGYITKQGIAINEPLFDLTGVFTILTPYLLLSWVAYDLLHKDLKVEKKTAIAATHALPMVLFIAGMHNFMSVLSLTGGVFLGYVVLIITAMYRKKFPKKHKLLIFTIQGVFLLGICLEIWNFFMGS